MSDDELIDVMTEEGGPVLGGDGRQRQKTRAEIHRDGDWHAAFHLWVVSGSGVLLQRRGSHKHSWPSRLDATAAGHLTAGEQPLDGLREAEEELGVAYSASALFGLGIHDVEEEAEDGTINREHQHLFGVFDDRPLTAFTSLQDEEVDGLVEIAHDAFAQLATVPRPWAASTTADARAWDGSVVTEITVSGDELVPAPYLPALPALLARVVAAGSQT